MNTNNDFSMDEDDSAPLPVIKLNFDMLKKFEELSERAAAAQNGARTHDMDTTSPDPYDDDEDDVESDGRPQLASPQLTPKTNSIKIWPQPQSPPPRHQDPQRGRCSTPSPPQQHSNRAPNEPISTNDDDDYLNYPIPLAPPPIEDVPEAALLWPAESNAAVDSNDQQRQSCAATSTSTSTTTRGSSGRIYSRRRITAHDFYIKLKTGKIPSADDPTKLVVDQEPLKSILSRPNRSSSAAAEEGKRKKRIVWADSVGNSLATFTRIPSRSEMLAKYGQGVFYNPYFNMREHCLKRRGISMEAADERSIGDTDETGEIALINSRAYNPQFKALVSQPIMEMRERYKVSVEKNEKMWAKIRGDCVEDSDEDREDSDEQQPAASINQLPKCLIDLFKPTNYPPLISASSSSLLQQQQHHQRHQQHYQPPPPFPNTLNRSTSAAFVEHNQPPAAAAPDLFPNYWRSPMPVRHNHQTFANEPRPTFRRVALMPTPPIPPKDPNWIPPLHRDPSFNQHSQVSRRPPLLPTPVAIPRKRPLLPTPMDILPRKLQRNNYNNNLQQQQQQQHFRFDKKMRREDGLIVHHGDGFNRRRNEIMDNNRFGSTQQQQQPPHQFRPPFARPPPPPPRMANANNRFLSRGIQHERKPYNNNSSRPFQKSFGTDGRLRNGTQIRH